MGLLHQKEKLRGRWGSGQEGQSSGGGSPWRKEAREERKGWSQGTNELYRIAGKGCRGLMIGKKMRGGSMLGGYRPGMSEG